jgi:hypothetical protein
VNYFGHAWVAAWFSGKSPFVFGAMLPDFANILGVAIPTSRHPELEAGIRLHHETDRVFHDAKTFRELELGALATLGAAGLPKGARRALAHVGVEFLIDAELDRHAPSWGGYAAALRFGASVSCSSELCWRDVDMNEPLAVLCQRLAMSERPSLHRRLATRLVQTLASRPRLALEPDHVPLVEAWLGECQPLVAARLPSLLVELARGLGAPYAERAIFHERSWTSSRIAALAASPS